jgi:hypothetical protein
MKKFRELTKNMYEEKKDKYDEGEYDQEGDMAKSDLRSIIANAKKMHDMIEDDDNLPEWVQSKITKAEDYISTVANYMAAEMSEETKLQESGGPVVYKKGDDHIEKYGEDSFALYKDGKKAKYYTSIEAAKEAMNEDVSKMPTDKLQKHWDSHKDEQSPSPAFAFKLKQVGKELAKRKSMKNEEVKKSDVPAYLRKQKGEKPLTMADVKAPRKDSISAKENLAKARNEEVEQIEEKNVPTSPEKWAQAKSQAKAKFDVYPSAYANGWAAKKYKEMGGSWKSVSEETKPPFDGPYTKAKGTVTDKSGAKHSPMSRARDIAHMAMKKQAEKMKKPVKEETSMKAKIVKDIMKKKKGHSEDAFQKDPELSTTLTKTQ